VSTPDPASATAGNALELKLDQLPALSIDEVVERTLTKTLNATTAEDVLADPEAVGLGDYAGKVLTLLAVAGALPSAYKTGPSRFIVVDCIDNETGGRFSATCGSPYVISRALRLAELGLLPAQVRVVELESTANPGQSSLWLVKP
jgi:hypothetical protein